MSSIIKIFLNILSMKKLISFLKIKNIRVRHILLTLIYVFIISLFVLLLINNAWLCDDAQITFRTVDNFVNGYGLTWNIDERVQSYTHPLWMFLFYLFYFFTREIYFTSIILSICLTLFSAIIYLIWMPAHKLLSVFGVILLCLSKAFIDYSVSGLENPLTYILIVVFYVVYSRENYSTEKLFYLMFIASLSMVNRMDIILFFLPGLVYYYFMLRKNVRAIFAVILGIMPFLFWEIFSIIYYGFPFPNTAYAKLNTGIHSIDLIKQGLVYYKDSFINDTVTLVIIIISFFSLINFKKDKKNIYSIAGLTLYLIYIIKIGGCFMSGRFFSIAYLVSVIILTGVSWSLSKKRVILFFLVTLILSLVSLKTAKSSFFTDINYSFLNKIDLGDDEDGIADEKQCYFKDTGLLGYKRRGQVIFRKIYEKGLDFKKLDKKIVVVGNIGRIGYDSMPNIHIIDFHAIADAFLARLPTIDIKSWRIGHFIRQIPYGYEKTVKEGMNFIEDKKMAEYYDILSVIIKDDIWSVRRFKYIFNMNLRKYDYLLNR